MNLKKLLITSAKDHIIRSGALRVLLVASYVKFHVAFLIISEVADFVWMAKEGSNLL